MARRRYEETETEAALSGAAEEAAGVLERQGDRRAAERLRNNARHWKPSTFLELEAEIEDARNGGLLGRLLGR